jgi:electron transport complex protein RnfC
MYQYYKKRDFVMLERYHVTDCIECGSCTFRCPARMPLTHAFKTAKLLLKARADKEKAAAQKEAAK